MATEVLGFVPSNNMTEVQVPLKLPQEAIRSTRKQTDAYEKNGITLFSYQNEKDIIAIRSLMEKDLSEPYSIFTYRYFIHNWPQLSWLARDFSRSADPNSPENVIGAIVCKLEPERVIRRGYIAMLAVSKEYRKRGIGRELVLRVIEEMSLDGCDEVVLETEITNQGALNLYESLGFLREKRLLRYYLNGQDAFRLKLPLLSFNSFDALPPSDLLGGGIHSSPVPK